MGARRGEKVTARVGYCHPGKGQEDRQEIFDFFSKIFSEFREVEASEILEHCRNDRPDHRCDLVVMDCRDLSDESFRESVELLETLKRRDEHIKQLILYRVGELERLAPLMGKGARCFFPVPWNGEAIRYVLRPLLELMTLPERLKRCQHELRALRESEEGSFRERIDALEARLETEEGFYRRQVEEMEQALRKLSNMHSLVLQAPLDGSLRSYLGRAERAAAILRERLEEIRRYREERSAEGASQQTFNLNSILSSSSDLTDERFEAARMELVFDVDRSVPAQITGDPVLLGQTLVKLFETFIDLDEAEELILHLYLEAPEAAKEERWLHFELREEGGGPRSEAWFESLTRRREIREVARWIREMGGRLEVGGREGTPLAFAIPVRQTERRSYRLPSREWMEKRMLIVDGNDVSARALEGMLGYFHFEVDRVADIPGALEKLYAENYDVIFVHEALFDNFVSEALSMRREAKLVLLTREREARLRQRESAELVDAMLPLPFTQQDLFDGLLEIYSGERMENLQETLEILRENLTFLLGGKTAVYLGPENSDWLSVQRLLEGARIVVMRGEDPEQADTLLKGSDLVILHDHYPPEAWERLLALCQERCDEIPVFAVLERPTPEKLASLRQAGIERDLPTPVEPESFYRLLVDTMIERGHF
jgi:CheY-like chemotaxis protein